MKRDAHRLARLMVVTCLAGPAGTSVFAQSNRAGEATNALNRSSIGIAQAYVATEAAMIDQPELPPNVEVSALYRPLLESMLRRSPTFRRQCLRIANEPLLTVHLRAFPLMQPTATRAMTHVVRERNGRLSADIEFDRRDDGVELIAHEFEHVIEQLDGVDLRSKAALPDSGVHHALGGGDAFNSGTAMFETTRAKKTGLRVAEEFRTGFRRAD